MSIKIASEKHASSIVSIYNYYIEHTHHTFEETPLDQNAMEARITESIYPWLIYEKKDEILGYAYISPWKSRSAYRHSAESSIYLKKEAAGRGVGTELYAALIELAKKHNIHALIAGISLPNPRSIALQEKFGFKKIAQFKEVGLKFGEWIDVGYWELLL
jgi:L-amino acid N-acyltransferase YncA